ncbi:MAG: hypothetical protein ACR2M1_03135 [Gemmatimonadaceae bacterium]
MMIGWERSVAAVGLVAATLVMTPAPSAAQRYFGQNQVEYRHFRWRVLETEHFYIHYYPEEQFPIKDAARMAERSYTRLSRVLGHQFREKKPILLYASRQDFAESNINGDLGEGVGGVTEPLRQRIELPFTGDYDSFQHVLTHEMVHQFQFDIFSRGRAGENIQTLEAANPPLWFLEGMAEYLSLGPNHPLTTMWIRDAVANGNLPTIQQMTEHPDKYFPYRYGEALWRYVGERWGDDAVGEILDAATTVGIDRAFQRILGVTLDQLSDQWREASRQQYLPQLAGMQRVRDFAKPLLTTKITGGNIFLSPVLSPDGRTIAFLSNGSVKKGEVFIDLYLGNALTGKRIKRLVETTTNPRFEELRLLYSQGSFSPDGNQFAFTAQTGGKDVLSIADIHSGGVKQFTDLPVDGVLDPSYSPDGKHIVFSGVNQGITDLYVIDVDGKNVRHLTQDKYGDLQPSWSPDGTRIAFATDRASTKLADLDLGKPQIAILNVADGSIQVLPGQIGTNINPVWSPDGSEIAYISDRNGTPNIYLRDLRATDDLLVTNLQGGVSQFTETSPAITWSRGTNRLAFTYFTNNDYTVWYLDNPRSYAQALPKPTPAMLAGAAPGTVVKDSTPGANSAAISVYRGPSGARQSAAVAITETPDSSKVSSIATLLNEPRLGLPDTATFKDYAYKIRFAPDYISGGTVGVSTGGGYGTQYGGGTTLVFSDLTGSHELAVGAGVNGQIKDASFLVDYANLSHRWQYLVGAAQNIAYAGLQSTLTTLPDGTQRETDSYIRYVIRTATLTTAYPFSRFSRVEFGVQGQSYGQGIVNQNYDYVGQTLVNITQTDGGSGRSFTFASPLAAFVIDNSLFGTTGPISGRRMRFQVQPSVGSIHTVNYLADYRRYDPVVFNTLTFATRFFYDASTGRDSYLFPIYVGRPEFVRGYDQSSLFGGYSCASFLGNQNSFGVGCSTTELLGTRVAVFNEELRFPIIRRFDLGKSPIGLPPVDGAVFYDAGLAYSQGQTPHLARPANYDPKTQRYFLRSYGAGVRVNLFNLAVLRWDYAKPIDRVPSKFNWTFSLGASF